ncbi:hypothetical protein Mapa_014466 [Marchantia paleacea]|nr:hypothetical protein Mapa_014466 [Marchantia paleacea]
MRMRIIRCVMRFDPLHSLESNFWQAKTDLCMWMLGEAKYNAWSQGLHNIRLKVEQASFAYLSLFAYILSVCFVFVYAVWPPWLMVEIKKLLPPRKVIRAMYDEYQFRSRTLFKKRLVDALISAATPSAKIHGLILTYFAEKILLHEAHSRALEAKPPAEPVLLKVLTEAIEAHPDAIEFPVLNSSREVAADGETRIKKTWKNKMKSVSENMLEENWPIPSASRLKMAGLKICTCDMIHQTQLQLHQRVPVLRVPKVLIDDGTDSLLRNLAALERLKYPLSETPLACFIKLMDNLIDTPEDVLVLREAGVIVHHLGSEKAVADMWNALGTGLPFYPSEQWATMLTQINVLTRDRHTLIWVEFKQKYMSKPWLVTGTVAAVLLLILAVSQTLFTAFQVFLRVPIH